MLNPPIAPDGAQPEPLGRLIRRARRALKLSQSQLAFRIGAEQSTVSKVEKGQIVRGHVIPLLLIELKLPRELMHRPRKRGAWDFIVDESAARRRRAAAARPAGARAGVGARCRWRACARACRSFDAAGSRARAA